MQLAHGGHALEDSIACGFAEFPPTLFDDDREDHRHIWKVAPLFSSVSCNRISHAKYWNWRYKIKSPR